jgi:hypothetical protein
MCRLFVQLCLPWLTESAADAVILPHVSAARLEPSLQEFKHRSALNAKYSIVHNAKDFQGFFMAF